MGCIRPVVFPGYVEFLVGLGKIGRGVEILSGNTTEYDGNAPRCYSTSSLLGEMMVV